MNEFSHDGCKHIARQNFAVFCQV